MATATDNILPGLGMKYFSLPRFAVTDPKQSEIRKAKRLVRGKKVALSHFIIADNADEHFQY